MTDNKTAKSRDLSVETLQKAARILKTVAHPARLSILQVLEEEERMDVSGLCSAIGQDCEISMMSHHLAKMRDNGILTSQKEGKRVYYSIADKNILNIFDCMGKCTIQ